MHGLHRGNNLMHGLHRGNNLMHGLHRGNNLMHWSHDLHDLIWGRRALDNKSTGHVVNRDPSPLQGLEFTHDNP